MKSIFAGSAFLALILLGSVTTSEPVEAKGCIKGAIVGGVVGHMAGHGKVGVVAGCVIGHHEATERERQQHQQQQATPSH